MSIDIKFFGANGASGDGDGHTLNASLNGGAASAGNIIVVNTVSHPSTTVTVSDDVSGTTGWTKIGDSVSAATGFRTTKWWKLCVGSETSVTCDWSPSGNGRAFEAVICRGLGSLNEAYLISEGIATNHFSDVEWGNGNGSGGTAPVSTNNEVYIGCTSIGNSNYSFAGFSAKSAHDNNGVTGDGQNVGGGSVGFGVIMHINDDVASNSISDQLLYGSRPQVETFDSWIGIRDHSLVGVPKVFSGQAYGGSDSAGNPGRELRVNIGGSAAAGDWIVVGAISSAGHCGPGIELPVVTDNIDTVGSDWTLVTDDAIGEGSTYGSNQSAIRFWQKECAGGESYVDVDFLGSTNKAIAGVWIPSPTQPLVEIEEGPLTWDTVDSNIYTVVVGPDRDHETYVYIALGGTSVTSSDPTSVAMSAPVEDDHSYANASGECWAQAGYNHDESGNMAGDTPVMTVKSTSIPSYAILFGVNGDAGGSAPPVNTVSPFIDNTSPTVGDVLTGDPGTWTGDGSITYTYQWLNYDGSDHNISGETDITYTVLDADIGKAIWLDVRAHSEFVDEPGVEAVSDHTDNVLGNPPVNSVAAHFDNTSPLVGDTITASSTWTGTATITYSYQFYHVGDPNVTIQTGAMATYDVVSDDIGFAIGCRITATNDFGEDFSDTASSDVVPADDAPPVNTVRPTLTGTLHPGHTLTAHNGTWTGSDIVFTYEWFTYDGADYVSVGTGNTYAIQVGDVGKGILVEVTGTNDFGNDTGDSLTSADVTEETISTTVFDVDDVSTTNYVRAGRSNMISISTTDHDITFVLQVSDDGVTWYDYYDSDGNLCEIAVTAGAGAARPIPAGIFYFRLKATVADDGAATVSIGTSGGY